MTGFRPNGAPPLAPADGVSWRRRLIVAAASGILTLIAALVVVGLWALWIFETPGPKTQAGEPVIAELRVGASLPEIAATLERAGVVRSASVFMTAAQITGSARALKAGEYAFPSGASMSQVILQIRHGLVLRHRITIPEGVTSEVVAQILAQSDVLSGVAPTPAEGTVLPETYDVRRGDDRATVLRRMVTAQDRLLASLWADRRPDLPLRSPEQAVILASIVEKETGKASERPKIAAIFLNRLRKGMRLESDPTIIYGLTGGKPLGRGLRLSELQRRTAYNTYLIDGLPPTPIANPGRAAIAAVLDPPESADLFFVADGTGGHAFAATLAEHEKNVLHWREVERRSQSAGGK